MKYVNMQPYLDGTITNNIKPNVEYYVDKNDAFRFTMAYEIRGNEIKTMGKLHVFNIFETEYELGVEAIKDVILDENTLPYELGCALFLKVMENVSDDAFAKLTKELGGQDFVKIECGLN